MLKTLDVIKTKMSKNAFSFFLMKSVDKLLAGSIQTFSWELSFRSTILKNFHSLLFEVFTIENIEHTLKK